MRCRAIPFLPAPHTRAGYSGGRYWNESNSNLGQRLQNSPITDADAAALTDFVDPYVCPIQFIPKGDTRQPPGHHHGTGWFYTDGSYPYIVTCEHVARWQKQGALGYQCLGSDYGISIEGEFCVASHPEDAAIALIPRSFTALPHKGKCLPQSLLALEDSPVEGELFFAHGFPRTESRQAFETQLVQANSVFLRQVALNPAVYQEVPPHPLPDFHICLAWDPENAAPLLGTAGALSLPDGMSGSLLWNTRFEEITRSGGRWTPTDARVAGMIWGHSAKAGQLYATPIGAIARRLLREA